MRAHGREGEGEAGAGNSGPKATLPGCRAWLCSSAAVWPWASDLASLGSVLRTLPGPRGGLSNRWLWHSSGQHPVGGRGCWWFCSEGGGPGQSCGGERQKKAGGRGEGVCPLRRGAGRGEEGQPGTALARPAHSHVGPVTGSIEGRRQGDRQLWPTSAASTRPGWSQRAMGSGKSCPSAGLWGAPSSPAKPGGGWVLLWSRDPPL